MKSMKKIVVIFLVIISVTMLCNITKVDGYAASSWKTLVDNQAKKSESTLTTSFNDIAGAILTIARVVCAGIAIIMLIAVGMKYMVAAPGDRADIKKHAVPYVVGAVIMFGSTGILTIIQKFAATVTTSDT